MTTTRLLAATLFPALLLVTGCEAGPGGGAGTATIAIGYRAQAASPGARQAASPPGITRVVLTVSAADMKPVTADLPIDGTIVEVAVPAGNGRLFTVDGYTGAARTHAGRTSVARLLADTRTRVTIPLDPLGADGTPPTILSTSPAGGATGVPVASTISLTFSEPMNPATVTGSTVLLDRGGTPVAGTVSCAGSVATFTPTAGLQPLTLYRVTVKGGAGGVTDLAGNPLAADATFTFTTAFVDVVPPTIASTSPANGATGVPVGSSFSVTFSEPMDPASINASSILFTFGVDPAPVAGTVSCAGTVATFTPASNLQPLTLYRVTVKGGAGGVADLAGNPLAADATFTFTTAPAAVAEAWRNIAAPGGPSARHYHSAVWAGPPVNQMIVWGGGEDPASGGIGGPVNTGLRYRPGSDSWTPTSTVGAPAPALSPAAVWWDANTPPLMIVWDGVLSAGARYDPASDTWSPMSAASAPVARYASSAVWTGSRLIVWGGYNSLPPLGIPSPRNDGGIYDPVANDWQPVTTGGAPSARTGHSAVWAGPPVNGMIVWGGTSTVPVNTGAIFRPATGWTPLALTGAPSARNGHTAVWTGTHMIVWGGQGAALLDDGAAYDPVADSWTPLPALNTPSPRSGHTALWTGAEMVVWGGSPGYGGTPLLRLFLGDGAAYNPASGGSWRTLLATGAPVKRADHTAVWTGTEMLVWGGVTTAVTEPPWTLLDSGARYTPP